MTEAANDVRATLDPSVLIYIERWSDETMPCAPKLDAWAAWLAQPDPYWNRPEAATDGEEFEAFTLIELGDVRADWTDGKWVAAAPPPGAEQFYLRYDEGTEGWDPDFGGDVNADGFDLTNGLDSVEPDWSPIWLACVKSGPKYRVRFEAATLGRPARCVIVGEVH